MNKKILTDSCFWLGLLDPKDQHHEHSKQIAAYIDGNELLIPWPCLYETISTHLSRRREQILYFEEILSKKNIILLEDADYKNEAIRQLFTYNKIYGHTYSLTDCVIREMLKDINMKIDYFVTYNTADFKDICDQRLIEIFT